MNTKPLIAVTRPILGDKIDDVRDRNYPHFQFILSTLGANLLRVSPDREVDLSACDGLLLTGGVDIHPSHYGEEEREGFRHLPDRDAMEMTLFRNFKSQGKPIMGVCRGMQMINVCLGGSLHQEISEHFDKTTYPRKFPAKYFYRKNVTLTPDSLLSHLFKKESIQVNSLHHQAVNKLGDGVKVSAIEPKGIIQGIEHETIKNIFGVQWHPELMHFSLGQWKLFKHFINLC